MLVRSMCTHKTTFGVCQDNLSVFWKWRRIITAWLSRTWCQIKKNGKQHENNHPYFLYFCRLNAGLQQSLDYVTDQKNDEAHVATARDKNRKNQNFLPMMSMMQEVLAIFVVAALSRISASKVRPPSNNHKMCLIAVILLACNKLEPVQATTNLPSNKPRVCTHEFLLKDDQTTRDTCAARTTEKTCKASLTPQLLYQDMSCKETTFKINTNALSVDLNGCMAECLKNELCENFELVSGSGCFLFKPGCDYTA